MIAPLEKELRIGLLPIDGFALMSYASLVEPMRAANLVAGRALFDVRVLSHLQRDARPRSEPSYHSSSSVGVELSSNLSWTEVGSLDWLFVIAGGSPEKLEDDGLFASLRDAARRGVKIGGISGGPVLMARAGLLAGRRTAVHWEHSEALTAMATGAIVQRSLYIIDRDRITCAGGTAPLDMMHTFIAAHCGAGHARQVSDWFMHTDARPGHGPQRADLVARHGVTNATVARAVELMESHLADTLPLETLAELSGKSSRQLARLFMSELGVGPAEFYRGLRLDIARELLERSTVSVTEIALATGFADAAHFSSVCKRHFGAPPSHLRRTKSATP